MITISDQMFLSRLLHEVQKHPFQWGVNDCNTLAVEWMDRVSNSDVLSSIEGKYRSFSEAIKFYEEFPSWQAILHTLGWDQVDTVRNGDLILRQGKSFVFAHIFLGGLAYSVDRHKGLVAGTFDNHIHKCEVMRCLR